MPDSIDQVIDDVLDYADFEEVASVTRAKLFVTAATRYLLMSPQSQADQGTSMTMSTDVIERLLVRAREYVSKNATGVSRVRFLSFNQGFLR